ncbi:MAG: hypothetical protein ACRCTO_23105 [Pseudomonas paracarnis]
MTTRRRVRVEVPAGTYSSDRPTVFERLGRLAGVSTYRVPVEGKGTSWQPIPSEHALCLALGMARTSDPLDVGPDVAFDMATQSSRHQRRVCEALTAALSESRDHRAVRRNRPYLAVAAWAAYTRLVYGTQGPAPDGVKPDDWDVLVDVAERILATLADQAVWRAGRALSRDRKG